MERYEGLQCPNCKARLNLGFQVHVFGYTEGVPVPEVVKLRDVLRRVSEQGIGPQAALSEIRQQRRMTKYQKGELRKLWLEDSYRDPSLTKWAWAREQAQGFGLSVSALATIIRSARKSPKWKREHNGQGVEP